jgi:type IV pilus assembly protein PilA
MRSNMVHRDTTKAPGLAVDHSLYLTLSNQTMTLQTMSHKADTVSAKQPARHQRFAASPRARMRRNKGFTLVELMVVIVIVGILSAVALPKFLGLKAKAKINTQIGEASGLAKECATAIIADGTYPEDYKTLNTNTGLSISDHCNNGAGVAPDPSTPITFTTTGGTGKEGATCGADSLVAAKPNCQVKVLTNDGTIEYAAV